MVHAIRNLGRPGIASMAISAVDTALWDLKGRLFDVPVAVLFGAVRDAVPIYGSGGFTSYTIARLQKQLGGWAEAGISWVKMKVGRDPRADIERVRAAREAIGPRTELFAELAKSELAMPYRSIHGQRARIVLVEAGRQILPAFTPSLAVKATRSLEWLGVEVRTGVKVESCDIGGISAAGRRIDARTLVWAAGVQASAAARWLAVRADGAGRVQVEPDLSLPGDPNAFVIGDTAALQWRDGKNVPGIAAAAKQEGTYIADLLFAGSAASSPLPLSPPGRSGDHRTQIGGSGFRRTQAERVARVAAVGSGAHFFPHRLSQSHDGRDELAVGVLDA
ncbi:MAG: FAD-dependent oxidoreductase [Steroidobacteraceae bacterium]